MIAIEPVNLPGQMKAFIDFPHELYYRDPNYVPELFIAQRDLLTPGKHPFHEHSTMQLFVAKKNGGIAGRIAAIQNNNHNKFNHTSDGFFGFFDCVNDQQVANALFEATVQWLKNLGLNMLIGPLNPSTNEPTGVLIKGFHMPPVAMMTYNKPYYAGLMEGFGMTKNVDLYAYHLDTSLVNQRTVRLQQALLQRLQQKNVTIRCINIKNYKIEVARLREIYNAAWDKNLGFVPMTENEFNYLAKDLKMLLDPDLCLIAEHNGKIVGFALAIPDINELLIKINKGRLLPTGILKLLFGLKKIKYLRVLALGVINDYRKMGIEACFYAGIIQKAQQKNLRGGEASWVLEGNEMMNKAMQNIKGELYKTYRIYEKSI